MTFRALIFASIVGLVACPASALDLTSDIDAASDSHADRANTMNNNRNDRNARASSRDRSNDVCYQLRAGSDAQLACLGEHIAAIRDDRARYIMQGSCFGLGSSDFSSDLSYICDNGVNACSILDDNDAAYHCRECGATRRWLAVYSLGSIIQCFN